MSSPAYPAIIPLPEHHHDSTSYPFNAKIMVVAVASLLVVTSFVLLLHVYAKWWFFTQSRGRRLSLPDLPPPPSPPMLSQLLHRRLTADDVAHVGDHGLDPLVIASLPTFVYKWDGSGTVKVGLECVVCLSLFEENERGRRLPKCHHAFHVDCIDMWLMSHSTCPLCRNKVVVGNMEEEAASEVLQISSSPEMVVDSGMGHGILLDGNISQLLEVVVEDNTQASKDSSSSSSSSSSPSSCTLSESLKRMLSRSRSESRVFPSADHVSDR